MLLTIEQVLVSGLGLGRSRVYSEAMDGVQRRYALPPNCYVILGCDFDTAFADSPGCCTEVPNRRVAVGTALAGFAQNVVGKNKPNHKWYVLSPGCLLVGRITLEALRCLAVPAILLLTAPGRTP